MKVVVRQSTEIISRTEIDQPTLIMNKETVTSGVIRHVNIMGKNAEIFEYDKTKDYMQTATAITGSLTNALDYNDATYDSVSVAANTAETDWAVYDLGVLDYFYIRLKIGKDDVATLNIYVYVSEDNVNWTKIACCNDDKIVLAYCRYIKVTYINVSSAAYNVYCYTLEAYRKGELYALSHGVTDETTNVLDYTISTKDDAIMVIVDNNGNKCYYSIIDEYYTDATYKQIEEA